VLAPTDEAFAKLDPKLVAHLTDPKNKAELQAVLKHHVIGASVPAADVVRSSGVRSLSGQRLPIDVAEGTVQIGGAIVAQADVRASNGIVHVIDRVLIPSTKNIVETAVGAGQFTTLAKALGAAGLRPDRRRLRQARPEGLGFPAGAGQQGQADRDPDLPRGPRPPGRG
jgi:uncharacterized surface protein with fasciclin (FAS1) repeats